MKERQGVGAELVKELKDLRRGRGAAERIERAVELAALLGTTTRADTTAALKARLELLGDGEAARALQNALGFGTSRQRFLTGRRSDFANEAFCSPDTAENREDEALDQLVDDLLELRSNSMIGNGERMDDIPEMIEVAREAALQDQEHQWFWWIINLIFEAVEATRHESTGRGLSDWPPLPHELVSSLYNDPERQAALYRIKNDGLRQTFIENFEVKRDGMRLLFYSGKMSAYLQVLAGSDLVDDAMVDYCLHQARLFADPITPTLLAADDRAELIPDLQPLLDFVRAIGGLDAEATGIDESQPE